MPLFPAYQGVQDPLSAQVAVKQKEKLETADQDGPEAVAGPSACREASETPARAPQKKTNDAQQRPSDWLANPSFVANPEPLVSTTPSVTEALRPNLRGGGDLAGVKAETGADGVVLLSSDDEDHSSSKRSKRRKGEKKHSKKSVKKKKAESMISSQTASSVELLFDQKQVFLRDVKNPAIFLPNAGGLSDFGLVRRGDTENLSYGEMYRHYVAKYRSRRKRDLHAGHFWDSVFARDKNTKKRKDGDLRYYHKISKSHSGLMNVKIVPNREGLDIRKEHLILPLPVKCDSESGTFIWDPVSNSYKPVAGEFASNHESGVGTLAIPETSLDYNRRLAETPQDVTLWLEYINSVSTVPGFVFSGNDKKKTATNLAILERKMAIVEKSISLNVKALDLYFAKIQIGMDGLWDLEAVLKSWEDLEFRFPNNLAMWRERLKFSSMNKMGRFSVQEAVTVYDRCISKLDLINSGQLLSHQPVPGTAKFLLKTLIDRSHLLWSAGYREKAIGSLQAAIEFNLCLPESFSDVPLKTKNEFFTTYWETNTPRFGEPDAVHFRDFVAQTLPNVCATPSEDSPDNESEDDILAAESLTAFEKWLKIEKLRDANNFMPWRGAEENEPGDPDRLVLADDVTPCLVSLGDDVDLKVWLVCKLLALLSCPLPGMKMCMVEPNFGLTKVFQDFDFVACVKTDTNAATVVGQEFLVPEILNQAELALTGDHRLFIVCVRMHYLLQLVRRNQDTDPKSQVKAFRSAVKPLLESAENRVSCLLFCEYAACLQTLNAGGRDAEKAISATLATLGDCRITDLSKPAEKAAILSLLVNLGVICRSRDCFLNVMSAVVGLTHFCTILQALSPKISAPGTLKLSLLSAISVVETCRFFADSLLNIHAVDFGTSWKGTGMADIGKLCLLACEATKAPWTVAEQIFYQFVDSFQSSKITSPEMADIVQVEFGEFCEFYADLLHSQKLTRRSLLQALEDILDIQPNNYVVLNRYIELKRSGFLFTSLRRKLDALLRLAADPVILLALFKAELRRVTFQADGSQADALQADASVGGLHRFSAGLMRTIERLVEQCEASEDFWLWFLAFLNAHLPDRIGSEMSRILERCPWSKRLLLGILERVASDGDFRVKIDILTEFGLRVRLPVEELDLLLGTTENLDAVTDEPAEISGDTPAE